MLGSGRQCSTGEEGATEFSTAGLCRFTKDSPLQRRTTGELACTLRTKEEAPFGGLAALPGIDFKKCRMRFPPAASGTLEKPEPSVYLGWVPELWVTTST